MDGLLANEIIVYRKLNHPLNIEFRDYIREWGFLCASNVTDVTRNRSLSMMH
jgi:hypothetical protein